MTPPSSSILSTCKLFSSRKRARIRGRSSSTALRSAQAAANLAVKLDQPLFPTRPRPRVSPCILRALPAMILSDAFKMALIAAVIAFGLSLIARRGSYSSSSSSTQSSDGNSSNWSWEALRNDLVDCFKIVRGKLQRAWDRLKPDPDPGTPMTFDNEGGWGVCSLTSKQTLEGSDDSAFRLVEYTFSLPKRDNTLPLKVGQQVTLCCLDRNGNLVKAGFFPHKLREEGNSAVLKKGAIRIVAPKWDGNGDVEKIVGTEVGHFARVLESEFKLGDEIALQPGQETLDYRGTDFPITELFFLASGTGIVPSLDIIRSVLPSGSSSVRQTSLLWINPREGDFDMAFRDLEREFFKYNTQLDISCVLSDVLSDDWTMEGNKEVEVFVQKFRKGTMVVVAGPPNFVQKGTTYLMETWDYPEESICVLPP